ncbi:hypothetical protein LTR66_016909 [Elasticomyces elasticus]|nr:hypothetical protein LTR66_016909 [Elasticomyces elasticus]KAK5002368.1 hypothetical protein LTR28_011507 [Elasticomyces elasticus]
MSSNLMDTEIGGEQTQYEGYKGLNDEHKKSGGQMGTPTSTPKDTSSASAERGAQTAENIRYGQAVSEQGVGGFTTGSDGVAAQESGSGGAGGVDEEAKESRVQQGYGGEGDMDRTVGG